MKKPLRIVVICLIVVVAIGIIFFPKIKALFVKDKDEAPVMASPQQQTLSVNAQVINYSTLTDIFRTKGLLIPDEDVELTFETSGKIVKIYFNEGAEVTKGELLAKVNDETLQAELTKLEAQLPLAEEKVYRQKALFEKDAVSQESYEMVATELEKLKADIDLIKARINQTELRAPFDGVVGLRQVSEGAYASPTTVVTNLTKIKPLKLEFSVNEKQASDIRPGKMLNFTIENDLSVYQARVYAVESKLDEKTLSLKARALYDNPGGKLQPGRSATIEITMDEIHNTLVIPAAATLAEMGQSIAYIYKDGKARQVKVKRGARTSADVQIVEGLHVGDTVLVTGVMQLRDGMPVTINRLEIDDVIETDK
ncbi:efflux RND transporter periplasmic adaptor subunit [Bacteroidales bacterium OttesenSCG-928-B11]|nr:efflux RND transporter periplasmic adaptor subunit [Bacteroidales bacterium OttesenSCG-928-E04]MDL2308792.1 efflux RND transporter periplasmic adaptor subunit [Bacteroidales bacterium OttesenSCG-928-C03]MDL2311992.1 efflux RND transporter periplasmic adaptor subunit [Bacteroidales bacterium OttesenSCG-928-B11]